MKHKDIKIGSNRSFGIVFFVVFLLIGFWPILSGNELRIWSILISLIFLILGILNSKVLTPLNKAWFRFGVFLGNFVSPIIMGIIFFFSCDSNWFINEITRKRLNKFKKK